MRESRILTCNPSKQNINSVAPDEVRFHFTMEHMEFMKKYCSLLNLDTITTFREKYFSIQRSSYWAREIFNIEEESYSYQTLLLDGEDLWRIQDIQKEEFEKLRSGKSCDFILLIGRQYLSIAEDTDIRIEKDIYGIDVDSLIYSDHNYFIEITLRQTLPRRSANDVHSGTWEKYIEVGNQCRCKIDEALFQKFGIGHGSQEKCRSEPTQPVSFEECRKALINCVIMDDDIGEGDGSS
mgnify:CR=1 FL=1